MCTHTDQFVAGNPIVEYSQHHATPGGPQCRCLSLQAVGACKRCNIIHINQSSGERCDEDLLQALLAAKGKKQVRLIMSWEMLV